MACVIGWYVEWEVLRGRVWLRLCWIGDGAFVCVQDSMGKDGTQLLRHCVRLLLVVATDLVSIRQSGTVTTFDGVMFVEAVGWSAGEQFRMLERGGRRRLEGEAGVWRCCRWWVTMGL